MNTKYIEVKEILSGLNEISDSQFSRLVDVYGDNLVNSVIRDLVKEDGSVMLKVGKFVSKLYLNLDLSVGVMESYDYYIDDIRNRSGNSLDNKNEIISEIVFIVKKLNKLFDKVENIVKIDDEKKKPWISDKVEYCMMKCDDIELLNGIKSLYNEYVIKRNRLLEDNLKFVVMVARSFWNIDDRIAIDDLIQYGNMGLLRAVETYDPGYGVEFLTYAGYWIKESIMDNSKKVMYSVKIPMYLHELNSKRLCARRELCNVLGREPLDDEIAFYMGISLEKYKRIIDLFSNHLSLDESSGVYLDGVEVTRIELVADDTVDLEGDMYLKSLAMDLDKYMNEILNEREIFILKSLYGICGEFKIVELAGMMGITPQRVSQIKQNAFDKLLKKKEFRGMISYLR